MLVFQETLCCLVDEKLKSTLTIMQFGGFLQLVWHSALYSLCDLSYMKTMSKQERSIVVLNLDHLDGESSDAAALDHASHLYMVRGHF